MERAERWWGDLEGEWRLEPVGWCASPDFLALESSIQEQIKATLDAHGVRLPLPQRMLIDETSS